MWHARMPVNGFSFLSEKFFIVFIVQEPLDRVCMLGFVLKRPGTVAPGSAFDPECDQAVAEELAHSGWLSNFVLRGRNCNRKPTPRGVCRECGKLVLNPLKEKIGRSPRSR